MHPPPDKDEEDGDPLIVVLALAAVVIIVVLGFLLLWKMRENEKMQDCLMTGRRDCAPVAVPDTH
jgi:hypothetical protein